MKRIYKKANLFFLFVALVALPNACVQDDEFAVPPINCTNTFGEPTATLAEVLAYNTTGVPDQIPDQTIFTAYVVSSDQAGNFFSSLTLQDELENPSAAVQIELDRDDLYLLFPIGQQVLVNASNLYIDNDRGVTKIGSTFQSGNSVRVGRVPEPNVLDVIQQNCGVAGTPVPLVFNSILDALQPENINKLITINQVKFTDEELGNTYGESDGNGNFETVNRMLIDQVGQELGARNSGFALYANQPLPEGSGSITGVLGAFDFDEAGMPDADEYQFFIRDEQDVQFQSPRFEDTRMGIGVLRNLEEDQVIELNRFAQGIITLSANNQNNITARSAIIQDETGGMVLRFDLDAHELREGDEVRIYLRGLNTDSFGGVKQLEEIDADELLEGGNTNIPRIEVLGTNRPLPSPMPVSIAQVRSGAYESLLVEVQDVQWDQASQGGSLSGTTFLTDCENTLAVFTRSASDFSETLVPTQNGNIRAIPSLFGGEAQLLLRNTDDFAALAAPRCQEPFVLFEQDFASQGSGNIFLTGWMNLAENGVGNVWQGAVFSGNAYALGNQFGQSVAINSWLITPPIDLSSTQNESLVFDYSQNFYNGDVVSVLISTDYDGMSPSPQNFTWMDVTAEAQIDQNDPNGFFDGFASSAEVDLSGFDAPIFIAFVYRGMPNVLTTRFHLDNIRVVVE